jgi:hypothetical protein
MESQMVPVVVPLEVFIGIWFFLGLVVAQSLRRLVLDIPVFLRWNRPNLVTPEPKFPTMYLIAIVGSIPLIFYTGYLATSGLGVGSDKVVLCFCAGVGLRVLIRGLRTFFSK